MRFRLILAVNAFLFILFSCVAPVQALPVGAPSRTLDAGGFSLTGLIGYTDMEVDERDVSSKSFFLKGAFEGASGLTPYFKLGFADLEAGSFEGSLDFGYGGGVLLDIFTQQTGREFRVSLDTQVNWVESSEGSDSRDLFEGQLALFGSTKSGGTQTYGGFAASFLKLDSTEENGKGHLFFGVDYFMDFNFFFNAEAHFFGESALILGVGYLF